jgi:hypothetical protein
VKLGVEKLGCSIQSRFMACLQELPFTSPPNAFCLMETNRFKLCREGVVRGVEKKEDKESDVRPDELHQILEKSVNKWLR